MLDLIWLLDRLEVPGWQGGAAGDVAGLGAARVVDLHILVGARAGVSEEIGADGYGAGGEAVTPEDKGVMGVGRR